MKHIELSSNMVFMVVDNSEVFRSGISSGLRTLGFNKIFQSLTTSAAITALHQNKIDFLICEMNMQEINGFDFLKEVREMFSVEGMPFLMMGKEIFKEDISLLAEYEIDGFITKPINFKTLSEKIAACVSHYKDPENIEFMIEQAKILLNKNKFNEALTEFKRLLVILPESSRLRVAIAKVYRKLNDSQNAEFYLRQAVQRNPLYVQAFDELGKLYLEQNKSEEAIEFFGKAISLSPKNPLRYASLCKILIEKQRYQQVEKLVEEADKREVVFEDMFEEYGKALYYQQKLKKAVYYFERALVKNPNSKTILNIMAVCLKDLGRIDDALKNYNIALKLDPADTKILFNKALCYYSVKQFDKVEKLCHQILKIDPSFTKAHEKLQDIQGKDGPKVKNLL